MCILTKAVKKERWCVASLVGCKKMIRARAKGIMYMWNGVHKYFTSPEMKMSLLC